MIHILRASDLWMQPILAATMYGDRRKQFRERLGWSVHVDNNGYERDVYEAENPIYIILEDAKGLHSGSMRLLPTTGKTMIEEHFPETLNGQDLTDERIWECTRFCIAPRQDQTVALSLLTVAARLMAEAKLEKLVAIFDPRMLRVYNRSGIYPEILGAYTYRNGRVVSGCWSFDKLKYRTLLAQSGIDVVKLELVIANFKIPWVQPKQHLL